MIQKEVLIDGVKQHSTFKENIKIFFIILYVCGWLFPKLTIGGINLGIQDLACVLLLLNIKINKNYLNFFFAELLYASVILLFSVFEIINNSSLEGALIAIRIFLFVISGIAISRFQILTIRTALKLIVKIYIIYFLYNLIIILYNIIGGGINLIVFLRGYGDFRIKAPFEGGGTTTVPIGYMFSILLTLTLVHYNRWINFFFSICALGTASRSAILSVFVTNGLNMNFKRISSWLLAIPFIVLFIGFVLMKSLGDSGEIDGSSAKRFDLYIYALKLMWHNPIALFTGFGVGPKVLEANIGESFFESLVFNSLIQGGLILFISSIFILIKCVFCDIKYKLNYISIPVLIGNLIGGSNYFSMFAFPLMILIIVYTISSRQDHLSPSPIND